MKGEPSLQIIKLFLFSEETAVKQQDHKQDEEYDDRLDSLRAADILYTEYSLEEIIYRLAKVIFTQSLNKGNAEAQQALQKLTMFLETEANHGHISVDLEKKVLGTLYSLQFILNLTLFISIPDVLIASLSDTLKEYSELVASQALMQIKTHIDGQLYRQLMQLSPEDKAVVSAAFMPYREQNEKLNLQVKSS